MRPIGIVSIDNQALSSSRDVASTIADVMGFTVHEIPYAQIRLLNQWVETNDAALIVIGIDPKTKIQNILNMTRELRVPYLFVRQGQTFSCRHIALPVTRFLEDREKAPYCGSFASNFNSSITIFKPKDYGSAAQQNIDSIGKLLETRNLSYTVVPGKKDSYGIELEALSSDCDLCIVGASRDYGLDDILFGPKERKILKCAKVPVLLINPRGDLYPLCD